MSQLNYAVQITDIGIPLPNGLTVMDIAGFWSLYQNKQSKFYKWYSDNLQQIQNSSKSKNTEKILNKYLNMPLRDFITAISTVLERYFSQTSKYTPKQETKFGRTVSVSVSTGGALVQVETHLTEDLIRNFVVSVPFYLFSKANIDINSLPS